QGHYKSDCPKLKDQGRGNKTGNKNGVGEVRGKTYVLGGGDAKPDSNIVMCTFLLNKHYASVLFDSGADRSFVSTTFNTLLDMIPDTLDVSYAVELADGRISETNTILRGSNHHAVIVYDEKIVRIPYGDEVLIVQGDRSDKGKKSKLSIISCTKNQKYIKKDLYDVSKTMANQKTIFDFEEYDISTLAIRRIPTVAAAGQKGRQFTTPCPLFKLFIDDSKKSFNTTSATLMYAVMIQDRVSMRVRMSQPHKMAMSHNKDD
nr:hypothetical protein [Tanacetum cinerariifolium]